MHATHGCPIFTPALAQDSHSKACLASCDDVVEPVEFPFLQLHLQLGTIPAHVVERESLLAAALCNHSLDTFAVRMPSVAGRRLRA